MGNAVNGNVVDAIGGIHKTVLCSSLRMFVCSTVTVVIRYRQNPFKL